jgi:hypothetical protein
MREPEHWPDSHGTSEPLDGEDDLAKWAALDKVAQSIRRLR